jgi:hypothetical protein
MPKEGASLSTTTHRPLHGPIHDLQEVDLLLLLLALLLPKYVLFFHFEHNFSVYHTLMYHIPSPCCQIDRIWGEKKHELWK